VTLKLALMPEVLDVFAKNAFWAVISDISAGKDP
jgi:hypothetical protein